MALSCVGSSIISLSFLGTRYIMEVARTEARTSTPLAGPPAFERLTLER